MRAHHERNLWFGEPDFSRRFHRTCSFASFSGTSLIQGLALLPRLAFPAGLVPVCQTFVRRCQNDVAYAASQPTKVQILARRAAYAIKTNGLWGRPMRRSR